MNADPREVWARACERASQAVEGVQFERQADAAIDAAHTLLAVAHQLAGVTCPACGGYARTAPAKHVCGCCGGFGQVPR